MTVIRGDAGRPTIGEPVGEIPVTIELVGENARPIIGYRSDGTMIKPATVLADIDGVWSADVYPNSAITPVGTAYRIFEGRNPLAPHIVTVPNVGGPYDILDILTAAPGALLPAISAAGVAFTPDGSIAANNVQAAIVEVRDEAAVVELGYGERTTNFESTVAGGLDIPGCTTTITKGTRPIKVEFFAGVLHTVATGDVQIFVYEDGVSLGAVREQLPSAGVVGNISHPGWKRDPSPGEHTYKLALGNGFGGSAFVIATGVFPPAFIRVLQV